MSDSLPILPPIHLISSQPVVGSDVIQPARQRPMQSVSDLRWLRVEEFLNSSNLSANSRKVYERELRRFLSWTDCAWFDLKPRHIALYKAYLSEEVRTAQGKPLAKSSIKQCDCHAQKLLWLAGAVLSRLDALQSHRGGEVREAAAAAGAKFD